MTDLPAIGACAHRGRVELLLLGDASPRGKVGFMATIAKYNARPNISTSVTPSCSRRIAAAAQEITSHAGPWKCTPCSVAATVMHATASCTKLSVVGEPAHHTCMTVSKQSMGSGDTIFERPSWVCLEMSESCCQSCGP